MTTATATAMRLAPWSDAWFEDVLAIEQSAYSHPWTPGNFRDSVAAGYHLEVLRCGKLVTTRSVLVGQQRVQVKAIAEQVFTETIPLPIRRREELLGLGSALRQHALQAPFVLLGAGLPDGSDDAGIAVVRRASAAQAWSVIAAN